MDLTTKYAGIPLAHPLLPGASPLVDKLDNIRQLEDCGAPGIVLHSLFEEQIVGEQTGPYSIREPHEEAFAEARTYLPPSEDFILSPEDYLEHIRRCKEATDLPIFASLNGSRGGDWLRYAKEIEQAGADALELNLYFLPGDISESAQDIEGITLEVIQEVRSVTDIPIIVKLSPFYSSLPHFANEMVAAGANGLLMFNRFYYPDIDLENLEVEPKLELSRSSELLLRLRWTAMLHGRVRTSFGITGGVHTPEDIVKSIMVGADAVQTVSCLLKNGIPAFRSLLAGFQQWMEENEYESVRQMKGSFSHHNCPNPSALERTNYLRTLQLWKA